MKKIVFGIDLGNKLVKMGKVIDGVIQKDITIIPSRYMDSSFIGTGKFDVFSQKERASKDVKVFQRLNDNSSYLFGKDINSLNKDEYVIESLGFGLSRYETQAFKNLLSFSIAELANDLSTKDEILSVSLVTGVPTSDYVPTIMKAVNKLAKTQHTVSIKIGKRTKHINVNIVDVSILPQPIGTAYDLWIDDDFNVNDDFYNKRVGIIDVGGGTKLYDTIQNMIPEEENRSQKETGVYTLYDRIVERLEMSGELNVPNSFEIEKIIAEGISTKSFTYSPNASKKIDITKIVQEEIDAYTRQTVAETLSVFKNIAKYDTFIFTGGGSLILNQDIVKNELPNALFVKNPVISNLKGYMKSAVVNSK